MEEEIVEQENGQSDIITNENFLDVMNYETSRVPKMPENEYRQLAEQLKLDKENYANGTKEDQAVIEAHLILWVLLMEVKK